MARFEIHSHTHYSNLRLLDCINTPRSLVDRAYELGLAGIAITDHESLSNAVDIDMLMEEYKEKDPFFKIARGNEIYLTDTRDSNQQYYHFILIAKDAIGHKTLRELSSTAWLNSYYDRGMERVPTLKSELKTIVEKYGKGHLIASTACLGGEVSQNILKMVEARECGDMQEAQRCYNNIIEFIGFCQNIFEDDFYLEVQPAQSEEQITVNKMMDKISKALGIKIVVSTDGHFLKKEDRAIHKAYLNSKEGDREVDEFYQYAYLQSTEEVIENLQGTSLDYDELEKNTLEIYDKIEYYSLKRNQQVPQVDDIINYPKSRISLDKEKYPTLDYLTVSDNKQERYWINQCVDKLKELNLYNEQYLSRLEYEADIKKFVGERLGSCVFAYPIFLQHYINMIWECGSPVAAGRGSAGAGLNHYLLGITQTNPIESKSDFWRYMNKDRAEMPDMDIDISPTKRELIFEKIREERGPFGCVQVCTFSTESTKSAILTACRGYRSNRYPNGIDVDTAQYIASLAPQERGFLWPIHDMVYGNEEKGRKPVAKFVQEIEKYPGLLDIITNIEGLIKNRSIHASGVNFYGDDPYETACFMKATNGSIITQYSLHHSEHCGDTKMDFLVTQQVDIMAQCIDILQDQGYIEKELTLRQAYDKYIHPSKIPLDDPKLWDTIDSTDVVALFQLNTNVGGAIVRQLQPRNIEELIACNSLMRLMGEEGEERPADKYARFKSDINLWYEEMNRYGLTEEEQKVLEKYMLKDYGVPSSQEDLMLILMDKDVCGFSLAEANKARKLVAKKQMDKIASFKEEVFSRAKNKQIGEYVWHSVIGPQLGYSFSRIHGYSYSLIACQAAYLAAYFPQECWNTAYLRVISGLDADGSSNYGKIATGIGEIQNHGLKVSLIDINKSGYLFEPDIENHAILYGMKAANGLNGDIINEIIENRPYTSLQDFMDKTSCNKTVMISLIKSGAFDAFGERKAIMEEYIWSICGAKKRLTMQNFNALVENNIIPQELNLQKRLFVFNKSLKKNCKLNENFYSMNSNYYDFYEQFFDIDILESWDRGLAIQQSVWKKLYDENMIPAKQYLKEHNQELLEKLNQALFAAEWGKYAEGNYSSWEIDSVGFYYHPHELIDVDYPTYGICEFDTLSKDGDIDYYFKKENKRIPIYKTTKICGTVIAKDDMKSSISLLTPRSGVVNIKMTREYYARLNQQLSQIGRDGKKHVAETSWFKKGTLLVINGYRQGNQFRAKKYKKDKTHQVYRIYEVSENGKQILMTHLRWGEQE